MGVIKRFAISSMVLGVLAIAGGASALAFEGDSGKTPAVQPIQQSADYSEASSDLTSDVPSDDELPDTGASTSDTGAWDWFAPNGR